MILFIKSVSRLMEMLRQADPVSTPGQERNPEYPLRIEAAPDVSDDLVERLNEVGRQLARYEHVGNRTQYRYIARYKQGPLAWLWAPSLVEAALMASELEEDEQELPPRPALRYDTIEQDYGSPKRVERQEYREWKATVARLEHHNRNRRHGLVSLQEFMWQTPPDDPEDTE